VAAGESTLAKLDIEGTTPSEPFCSAWFDMQSRQMNVHKGLTSIRTHKSASKAGKICTICLPQQATTLVRLTQKRKSLDQADFPLGGNPPLPRYICPDRMFMTVR